MKIQKAKINNLLEINKLNKKYFKEIRDFRKVLEDKNNYFYICVEEERIIGFSGFHYQAWNNSACILNIFIHPNFRRQGYASKLINYLIKEARKTKARTIIAEAPSLSNALAFYLKNKFRICGYNDRYYNNRGKEKAIFLSYDLK